MLKTTSVRSAVKGVLVGYNREDIIWAAGLFEGEGSVCWVKGTPTKYYPRLQLKMTDEDVVSKFASIFNLKYSKVNRKSFEPHWKDVWYLDATGTKAYAPLIAMFPWLGLRRQERIKEVIAKWISTTKQIKESH